MMLLRAVIYAQLEAERLMFNTATGKSSRQMLSDASRKYITENVPAEYVDALVPRFEVSCKRRVFGTGYLEGCISLTSISSQKILSIVSANVACFTVWVTNSQLTPLCWLLALRQRSCSLRWRLLVLKEKALKIM